MVETRKNGNPNFMCRLTNSICFAKNKHTSTICFYDWQEENSDQRITKTNTTIPVATENMLHHWKYCKFIVVHYHVILLGFIIDSGSSNHNNNNNNNSNTNNRKQFNKRRKKSLEYTYRCQQKGVFNTKEFHTHTQTNICVLVCVCVCQQINVCADHNEWSKKKKKK